MTPNENGNYECKNIGCLDDGYILLNETDKRGIHKIKKCEYCHNNNKSRFAIHQVILRLQGATYHKRYHRYEEE